MSYYILKKLDEEEESEVLRGSHQGRCTLQNNLLWYATSLSPPTLFESESEARKAIESSKRVFKNAKFKLEEVIENAV